MLLGQEISSHLASKTYKNKTKISPTVAIINIVTSVDNENAKLSIKTNYYNTAQKFTESSHCNWCD